MQNRFKSKVLWGAIIAQVLSLLVTVGVIDTGMSSTLNGVAVAILEMLVVFGIVNNPTDKEHM